MRIAVLGPLLVDGKAAAVSPRDRVVLAALAIRPGEVVSSDRLADALWGDKPPASWQKVVPGCVLRLRRALGTDAIETTPYGYRLAVAADDVDAPRFERLHRRGRELLTLGEADRAGYTLSEALGLWRGRPLIDLEAWEPGRVEAERLEELRRETEESRLDAALQTGRHAEVLAEAQARVADAPLRERRWALLALAQYQAGRQAEALRTLQRARSLLVSELGLDPGPELVALERAILRQDPALVVDAAGPDPGTACPYLGLLSYDLGDAEAFFGRDAEVAECVRRLDRTSVLAVVGPSGSGKSSLVRAGVAAALERSGQRVAVVNPGAHPIDAIIAVPTGWALVVDQFEELFTLGADAEQQSRFVADLLERATHGPLVISMRADRLGDLAAHPDLARLVERGLYLLGPMTEDDLRAAIMGPAQQAGLLLEPGLADLLVREVEGEPGALPLLSHALRQTWERREGRTLTVAGYQASGGIRGAVAQSAERLYDELPEDQRPLLRQVLLRLVSAGPDREPIRNRVPRRVLVTDPHHERILELLVTARLVTADHDTAQIAHESLARAWPRLTTWLDEDVEGQRILRHLAASADAWDSMGRPESELYRGARLTQALEWRRQAEPDLSRAETDFLDAAAEARDADRLAAERRARQQKHARRRSRSLVAGTATLVVLAVVAAVLVGRQQREGEAAALAAVVAEAKRIDDAALATPEIDRSLLLAIEGIRTHDTAETRAVLTDLLSRHRSLIRSAATPEIGTLAASPDGSTLLVGQGDAGAGVYDAPTLDLFRTVDALAPSHIHYRSDGRQLLLVAWAEQGLGEAAGELPVALTDPEMSSVQPVELDGVRGAWLGASDAAYSADGRFVAVAVEGSGERSADDFATADTAVAVWDVDAPQQPVRRLQPLHAFAVELSADGRLLYVLATRPASAPRSRRISTATSSSPSRSSTSPPPRRCARRPCSTPGSGRGRTGGASSSRHCPTPSR